MIRLSICMATLNRAAFIGVMIDSILSQMPEDVELVIVDGASTDGTDQVIAARFALRPNCHYHRLDKKGGVDQDYCRAVSFAHGEFCWLMPDDDLLRPGAIATVLAHLHDEPDLIVVNAEIADIDLQSILVPRKMHLNADQDFAPTEQAALLVAAGNFLSYIGAVVIRRSVWEQREHATYFGTEFIHVGVIFQKPFERFVRVLADPLIRIRYGNCQWTARAFNIWMFNWPNLIWGFPHLPDQAKAAVCPREPWKNIRGLLQMKAHGCFTSQIYREKLAERPMNVWTRLKVRAVAGFPEVPFNILLSMATWFLGLFVNEFRLVYVDLQKSPYHAFKCWFGKG